MNQRENQTKVYQLRRGRSNIVPEIVCDQKVNAIS